MASKAGTGQREGYATAVAQLWSGLSRTLAQLDAVAAQPEPAGLATLPALQYRLHAAAEVLSGTPPPSGAEAAHDELLEALEDARDLTGEVAERGPGLALVPQWRVALFRVRLARSQLVGAQTPLVAETEELDDEVYLRSPAFLVPLVGLTVALPGVVAVAVGVLLGPWPIWAVGFALVGVAAIVFRR